MAETAHESIQPERAAPAKVTGFEPEILAFCCEH